MKIALRGRHTSICCLCLSNGLYSRTTLRITINVVFTLRLKLKHVLLILKKRIFPKKLLVFFVKYYLQKKL